MRHSISRKIVLLFTMVGLAVCILTNLLLPSLAYAILKPHIVNYLLSAAGENALRLSYIWTNNGNVPPFLHDPETARLLQNYYSAAPDHQEEIGEELAASFPDVQNLHGDAGAIADTSFYIMVTEQGDFFYQEHTETYAKIVRESDWYQNYLRTGEAETGYLSVITGPSNPSLRIACKVHRAELCGMECFFLAVTDFQNILDQFHVFDKFGIDDYLVYSEGRVVYRNLDENSQINIENFPDEMFEGVQYETRVWDNGSEVNLMTLTNYPRDEYRVAVIAPRDIMLAPYQGILWQFQLFLTALIVLLIVLFLWTLRGMLRRIARLDQTMEQVRGGDYNVSVADEQQDELGRLANTFNMMLEKVKQDTENEERMQYLLMVSAIDPHYIYNTLNTVTILAKMGRNDDVVEVNTALIATLKDRVRMKNYRVYDTVEREQAALEQYMVIQRYLCAQKIELIFTVPQEDALLQVPKNMIQPLVENAIKHGILCNEDENGDPVPGIIHVNVYRNESRIILVIQDNGAGMSPETVERFFCARDSEPQLNGGSVEHIGVYNVLTRLNYLYRKDYSFDVESAPGQGTLIRINIPSEPGRT